MTTELSALIRRTLGRLSKDNFKEGAEVLQEIEKIAHGKLLYICVYLHAVHVCMCVCVCVLLLWKVCMCV